MTNYKQLKSKLTTVKNALESGKVKDKMTASQIDRLTDVVKELVDRMDMIESEMDFMNAETSTPQKPKKKGWFSK
ncbi:MAG: hypothetical protein JXA43_02990 [Candidatus Diapherotrites archaeon]|nr:hypothetical protein [Candidatus Diapherotrites archaeon]